MAKKILFDRDGKCPICHNAFKSERCPHDYSYVQKVVAHANSLFDHDVQLVREDMKSQRRKPKT